MSDPERGLLPSPRAPFLDALERIEDPEDFTGEKEGRGRRKMFGEVLGVLELVDKGYEMCRRFAERGEMIVDAWAVDAFRFAQRAFDGFLSRSWVIDVEAAIRFFRYELKGEVEGDENILLEDALQHLRDRRCAIGVIDKFIQQVERESSERFFRHQALGSRAV